MSKLNFKKGETVQIISGEDRGKQGRVLAVIPKTQRAIIEGLNMISKHTKSNAQNQQGGIVKQEASVHISNIMLVDPGSGEATKVGRKKDKNGKLARYAKNTGEII